MSGCQQEWPAGEIGESFQRERKNATLMARPEPGADSERGKRERKVKKKQRKLGRKSISQDCRERTGGLSPACFSMIS